MISEELIQLPMDQLSTRCDRYIRGMYQNVDFIDRKLKFPYTYYEEAFIFYEEDDLGNIAKIAVDCPSPVHRRKARKIINRYKDWWYINNPK